MSASLGQIVVVAVIYVLAVMRVTRLINFDTVLDWLRVAVARPAAVADAAAVEADGAGQSIIAEMHRAKAGRWRTLQLFLSCPWCVSVWVAAGTAWLPLYHSGNAVVQYVGVVLAASMVVGLLAPLSADEYDIDNQPVAAP
jgi:hypothetical protein